MHDSALPDEADATVAMGEVAVLSPGSVRQARRDLPVNVTNYATSVRVHGHQALERNSAPRWRAGLPTSACRGSRVGGRAGPHRSCSGGVRGGLGHHRGLIAHLLAVYAIGASLVQIANLDTSLLNHRAVKDH